MAEEAEPCVYRFGRFELQPRDRRLLIDGEPAAIAPRAFDVLLALVQRAGQLVTKNELFALIWPNLIVEDNNLQQQVSALRKMLGGDAIVTVSGHGYRFALEPQRIAERTRHISHNLPEQLTSFIGRAREIEETARLLKQTRLLTLLGMGGVGKTRLALRLAADALGAYPDGTWFLDLAPISDPSLVPPEAAKVLGVHEERTRSLTETLCAHLHDRKALIILDNCEHLIAACASFANALLRAASELRIIATTREALRVPGEQTYVVLPMQVPDPAASADILAKFDAAQLFFDRARLSNAEFELTAANAPAVAELCARLEGIPLALELAAARVRFLSVADLNQRLRDRFALLTGGGRVLLERHQTLKALVDWSYDLLHDDERLLCDRLSVFASGFELAAAEEICSAEPLAPGRIVGILASLVEKSLVMTEGRGVSTRYRMLETIREYAHARLDGRGETSATTTRHCSYFLLLAKAANQGLKGSEQGDWAARLETELDNLRAAISFALDGGVDPIIAVKFEVALLKFWLLRGYLAEGRKYVEASLASNAVRNSDVARAHALYVAAGLATSQGEHGEAVRLLEACLALRRGFGNLVDLAATLSTLALVRLQQGDAVSARDGEEEALNIFRQLGDSIGEAIGLSHLGQIEMYLGHDREAGDRFESCAAIASRIKHRELEIECDRMLGALSLEAGDLTRARARFLSSLEACRYAGDKRAEAIALWWIGKTHLVAGELEPARENLDEALRAFRTFEMRPEMIGCIEDLALLAQTLGHVEDALRLYSSASIARERLTMPRTPRVERRWKDSVAAAQRSLGEEQFRAAWSAGRDWRLEDAVRHALAMQVWEALAR
jgi:non-specific serine/threonine protein kinase